MLFDEHFHFVFTEFRFTLTESTEFRLGAPTEFGALTLETKLSVPVFAELDLELLVVMPFARVTLPSRTRTILLSLFKLLSFGKLALRLMLPSLLVLETLPSLKEETASASAFTSYLGPNLDAVPKVRVGFRDEERAFGINSDWDKTAGPGDFASRPEFC